MKKRTLVAMLIALTMVFTSVVGVSAHVWEGNPIDTMHQWKEAGTLDAGNEPAVEVVANKVANEVISGKYKVCGTSDAKAVSGKLASKKNTAILIDTMPAGWFGKIHVPGAINCPAPLTKDIKKPDVSKNWQKETMSAVKKYIKANYKKGKKNGYWYKKKGKIVLTKKAYKNVKIVTYCGFVKCDRSHESAKYLAKKGFKKVYRYTGGISAWVDSKLPTEGTEAIN